MNRRMVQLLDESRNLLATAQVAAEGDRYGGSIDLSRTPAPVRALFEEFEEVVNDQMFSLLDTIEEKLRRLSVTAVFEDGCETAVRDLQVYPSTGDVSFKVAEAPDACPGLASRGTTSHS